MLAMLQVKDETQSLIAQQGEYLIGRIQKMEEIVKDREEKNTEALIRTARKDEYNRYVMLACCVRVFRQSCLLPASPHSC